MKIINDKIIVFFVTLVAGIVLVTFPETANAHIKWFIEFDISDPPASITTWLDRPYFYLFCVLSFLGVIVAGLIDTYWCKKYGKFTLISHFFSHYEDISLTIARIGTGVFFVGIWLVGGVILTPELLSNNWLIPYIQLLIPFSVMFTRTLPVAGAGILALYANGVYQYGLFHMLDYSTFLGIASYLTLSGFNSNRLKSHGLSILYGTLVFAFLWSAIEKLGYPQWFYSLLDENPIITMGFDNDVVIAGAAFVEFTLFFLLLRNSNIVLLVAFLCNLLISAGNIYFGKMDTIGHFPVNLVLLMMLIRGPLPTKWLLFDQTCKFYSSAVVSGIFYLVSISVMLLLYYGLHWVLYNAPQ